MRFTTSQTSFRAGRLSPKLFNRIDTEQYRNGGSIIEGVKVISEGGVERVKGTRILNNAATSQWAPSTTPFEEESNKTSFSILVGQTPLFVEIRQRTTNRVTMYMSKMEGYRLIDIGAVPLIGTGSTFYDVAEFDWAYADNTLVITHFSGTMAPVYVTFNPADLTFVSKSFKGQVSTDSFNSDTRPPIGDGFTANFPMSDVGRSGSPIIITDLGGTAQLRVTFANTEDVLKVRPGSFIYIEGLGSSNFGGDETIRFVVGEFHYVYSVDYDAKTADVQSFGLTGGEPTIVWAGLTTSSDWAYSYWANSDYPKTVTAHESRIIFGGTNKQPLTYFGSSTRSITDFNQIKIPPSGTPYFTRTGRNTGATLVTDPFIFTIATDDDSQINFVRSSAALIIGTDRRQHVVTGGDTILSAVSIQSRPLGSVGGTPVSAISGPDSIYFPANNGRRLFRFKFNDSNGSRVDQEIGLLISDILEEDPIQDLTWAPHLNSLLVLLKSGRVWGIQQNGEQSAVWNTGLEGIKCLAYFAGDIRDGEYPRGEMVIAYQAYTQFIGFEQSYFEFGIDDFISYDTADKNAHFFMDNAIKMESPLSLEAPYYRGTPEYFAEFPGESPPFDSPWMRTYIGNNPGDMESRLFAGRGKLAYIVPKEISPSGEFILVNLDNKEVVYFTSEEDYDGTAPEELGANIGDHWVIDDPTVLGWARVLVGAPPAPAVVATMPVEAGQQWGSAQMGIKSIDTLGIRFYKTYSFEMSSNNVKWQEERVADNEGKCTTGRRDTKYDTNPAKDQIVYLRNTKAEPFCILGINLRGASNDG